MIKIKNLNKKYGSQVVLSNISVEFEKGKTYGIVGENGAGKTTFFRCIAGLENYDGEISSSLESIKNHLGLLLTEMFFFQKITGREYVQFLCNARNIKLKDLDSKNIFDLPLDQYASTYSTGMKKKLAIMAILLQDNKIFILDEPFNGVDIQSNIIITEILLEMKKLGKTIIISSHIFSTLSNICDEILLMKKGNIVKSVLKSNFLELEIELKETILTNKIEKLGLK